MAGMFDSPGPGSALQMHELIAQLDELRRLTILDDHSPQSFRARAYDRAVRRLRDSDEDLTSLSEQELQRRDGIGKAIASKMREFFQTGRIAKLETLRARFPPAVQQLARIPGVGPKTLSRLRAELGIESVEALRVALEQGVLRNIAGLGINSEQMLRRGLQRVAAAGKHRRQPIGARDAGGRAAGRGAGEAAERSRRTLLRQPAPAAADHRRPRHSGGRRRPGSGTGARRRPCRSWTPRLRCTGVIRVPHSPTRRGLQVDLRVVAPDQFGAAALYFTGSQAHNIRLRALASARGWLLNEYGLWNARRELIAAATEEAIYAALDLPPIAPVLREDRGEVEAAQRGELPAPVTVADLRGDLHMHTDASGDGRSSLEEMVAAAASRGFSYLAITDHGADLGINGVSRERLSTQRKALRKLNAAFPGLRLLHGVELNIGADGSLDYDAAFRSSFDWCVAGRALRVQSGSCRTDQAHRHRHGRPCGECDRPSERAHDRAPARYRVGRRCDPGGGGAYRYRD